MVCENVGAIVLRIGLEFRENFEAASRDESLAPIREEELQPATSQFAEDQFSNGLHASQRERGQSFASPEQMPFGVCESSWAGKNWQQTPWTLTIESSGPCRPMPSKNIIH